MGKYNKEKQEQWFELCDYVHKEILEYDSTMKFPRTLVLRLKGLSKGQFIANNKIKPMAEYSFKDILLTFKMQKLNILMAIEDRSRFKDEKHLINYIMVIIEDKINDVVNLKKKAEKEKKLATKVEVQDGEKAKYIKKTKNSENIRLKDLW